MTTVDPSPKTNLTNKLNQTDNVQVHYSLLADLGELYERVAQFIQKLKKLEFVALIK